MRQHVTRHLEDEGIRDLFGRLREDGTTYVKAEVAFYKELAAERGKRAGIAAAFGVGAAVLALAALITLLVGLVMTLSPSVGPGLATLIVVVVTLAIAGVLGFMARSRFAAATAPVDTP